MDSWLNPNRNTPSSAQLSGSYRPPMDSRVLREGHRYLPEVDGLRAIAVLAVIANHVSHTFLPSGYLGVDVFFVISGYVITLSLLDRGKRPIGKILAEFYARRVRRLAPALAVTVVTATLLIRLFDPDPNRSVLTGVFALFGLSNMFLYLQALDYFGPSVQMNPFVHTWSLGVEEQFYLFYPILLLAGIRSRGLGLNLRIVTVAFLSAASMVAFAVYYSSSQAAVYYLLPFRFWELGAGCILGIARFSEASEKPRFDSRPMRLLPGAMLVLLLAVFCLPASLPVRATTLAVALAALSLIFLRPGSFTYGVMTSRAVLYVGRLSYSLYLWHWVVLCVSRWTLGVATWTLPFQLVLIGLLAALSYHLIENPLRRARWSPRQGVTVLMGLGTLGICAAAVLLTQRLNLPAFSGVKQAGELADIAPIPGYRGKVSGRLVDDCALRRVYANTPAEEPGRVDLCTATVPGTPHLYFLGDSHALDLFPLSEVILGRRLASVTNLYETSCHLPPPAGSPPVCSYAMKFLEDLPDDPSGAGVIIIRNNYSPRTVEGTLAPYAHSVETLVGKLLHKHYRVVYILPSPKYYSVGPGALCSVQWFRPAWALPSRCSSGFTEPLQEELARRAEFTGYLEDFARKTPGFLTFDPFSVLCGPDSKVCTPIRAGQQLYRDESHLTERGSEYLAPAFIGFLQEAKLIGGEVGLAMSQDRVD